MSDVLTYEALKIERDHFQQINEQTLQVKLQMAETIKKLLAENVALKEVVGEINEELYGKGFEVAGWHLNGDLEPLDNWFTDNGWGIPETPATVAALAAIEARGVEKFAARRRAAAKVAREHGDEKAVRNLESQAWCADRFAIELREAK